jgi:hypothetical protein
MILGRNPYRELEKRLGYRFRRRALLELALTHPTPPLSRTTPPGATTSGWNISATPCWACCPASCFTAS